MEREISSLGGKLQALRKQRGMSQYRVAIESEIPQSTISRLEKGTYQGLNADSLKRLASALRTSTDFLLGESESSVDLSGKSSVYEKVLDAVIANAKNPMLVMALDGLICYSNLNPGRVGEPFEQLLDPSDWADLKIILSDLDMDSSPIRLTATYEGEESRLTISPAPTPVSSGKGEHLAFVVVSINRASDSPSTDTRGQLGSLARIAQRLGQRSTKNRSDVWGLVAREICQSVECTHLSILSELTGPSSKVAVHSWDNEAGYEVETDTVCGETYAEFLSSRSLTIKDLKANKVTHIANDIASVPLLIDGKVSGAMILKFTGLSEEEILRRLSQHSPLILQVSLAVDFARD